MFPSHIQYFYEGTYFPLPQPLLMYPSQPSLFYQEHLNQYYFQSSYRDRRLSFSNSFQYNKRKHLPSPPPQRESNKRLSLNDNLLKQRNQKTFFTKNKKHNHLRCIDLSNLKIFPPQENMSLKNLEEPRKTKKRWTKEEDLLLYELKANPKLSWREIATKFPTRTIKACQFRASVLKI